MLERESTTGQNPAINGRFHLSSATNAQTKASRRNTASLRARKKDQILRTVVSGGLWPGGSCSCIAQGFEAIAVDATISACGAMRRTANVTCEIVAETAIASGRLSSESFGRQQECEGSMPTPPHRSAIFLQQSRSAAVIAAPGNIQPTTGSAAKISASIKTPTFPNNFNIASLVAIDLRRNILTKTARLPWV